MVDNIPSELPELITSASNAVHQNLPETEKQTDGALSTVVGFFNNVVLYPVKKANLTYRYKLENFEEDLKRKTQKIPPENLQVPPTMIAGPVLEALRYTYDEGELREMYENLLASAMDCEKVSSVLPSYVDAIRQMSPLDARLIEYIGLRNQLITAHVQFHVANANRWYPDAVPYHFNADLLYFGNPFLISASLSNLIRLGLVRTYGTLVDDDFLKTIENHPYIQKQLEKYEPDSIKIKVEKGATVLTLDDYGRDFIKTCVLKE